MTASGSHTIVYAVMAVSRKAMTEGIRTFLFPGTLNKAQFYNPSVLRLRETREPAPFTQGSRPSLFYYYAKTPLRFRKGVLSVNQEGYQ